MTGTQLKTNGRTKKQGNNEYKTDPKLTQTGLVEKNIEMVIMLLNMIKKLEERLNVLCRDIENTKKERKLAIRSSLSEMENTQGVVNSRSYIT